MPVEAPDGTAAVNLPLYVNLHGGVAATVHDLAGLDARDDRRRALLEVVRLGSEVIGASQDLGLGMGGSFRIASPAFRAGARH